MSDTSETLDDTVRSRRWELQKLRDKVKGPHYRIFWVGARVPENTT